MVVVFETNRDAFVVDFENSIFSSLVNSTDKGDS